MATGGGFWVAAGGGSSGFGVAEITGCSRLGSASAGANCGSEGFSPQRKQLPLAESGRRAPDADRAGSGRAGSAAWPVFAA